jgi:hypothetical protein
MRKLNLSVNLTPGAFGEACCVPSQIQFPTNHFSSESCCGSVCADAVTEAAPPAKADKAKSVKVRMVIFLLSLA